MTISEKLSLGLALFYTKALYFYIYFDKLNNQILDEYITGIKNKLKNNKKITPGQKV